jgi:hypothetical protein
VYVVCFRVFTLLNIFLDLLAMCMSSVPGSSLTRISFWTCVLCVCRLFLGHHLIEISFWTCVLCVCFLFVSGSSLTRISVWTCVLCVCLLLPGRPLTRIPFWTWCKYFWQHKRLELILQYS